jgi:hypothetical protein
VESFHVCKAIKHFLQLLFNEGETVAKMFGIMIHENLNMSLTLIAPEKNLLMKKKYIKLVRITVSRLFINYVNNKNP